MLIRSAVLLALIAVGCGDDARTCASDLPNSCPMPIPSYQNEVAPILMQRCSPCHFPGGIADPVRDFSTYQQVYDQRSRILNFVYTCRMPPAEAPPLLPKERASLLAWLVCMAPNN